MRTNNIRTFIIKMWLVLLVGLFYAATTNGQCPASANYTTTANGSWSNDNIWSYDHNWIHNSPPSSGSVDKSLAINHNIVLSNEGQTVELSQLTSICGTLTIEGNLTTSGGCSPLNVYGKLIVNGNLESGQSIKVHPGAEVVVYGSWKITGGANTSIDGVMAVKGDVENKQGVDLSTSGNLLMYGNYTASSCGNGINGNVVIAGDLAITEDNSAGGSGSIYVLGTGKFGKTEVKGQAELEANAPLYNLYLQYLSLFGLAPLNVTISVPEPVCAGESVTYTATSATATNFKFFVNDSDTPNPSGASNTFTYTPTNGDVVKVVASKGTETAEAIAPAVVVNAMPVSDYTIGAPAMCSGSTGTVTLSGSEIGVSYQIYQGLTAIGTPVTGTGNAIDFTIPANTAAGECTISAINNITGCNVNINNSFTITVRPRPTATLQVSDVDAKVCFGEEVIFTANEGASSYEFFVDDVSQGEQNADNDTFATTTLSAGSHSVYVNVTDAYGCSNSSNTKQIEVLAPPTFTSFTSDDADNKICEGSEIKFTVDASNVTSYEFFVGDVSQGVSTDNEFSTSSLASGTNNVYAKITSSANGCSLNTPVVSVEVQQLPTATIELQTPAEICAGSETIFNATGGDSYQYYVNGLPVAGATNATFTSSTLTNGNIVSVAVTGSNGCVATATADKMVVNPLPSAVLGSSDIDNIVCVGSEVTFTAPEMEGATYEFTVGGNTFDKGTSNTYTTNTLINGDKVSVKVTSAKGCVSSDADPLDIVVQQKPGRPNAITGEATVFSPNPTTETYYSGGLTEPNTYRWEVSPSYYGSNGANGGSSFDVTWASFDLFNTFTLRVYGNNQGCGDGEYSEMEVTSWIGGDAIATIPSPNVTTFCKGKPITFSTSDGGLSGELSRIGNDWEIFGPNSEHNYYEDRVNSGTFSYMPQNVGNYRIKVRNYVRKVKFIFFIPVGFEYITGGWSAEYTFTVGDVPQNVGLTVDNNPVCKGAPAKFTATASNADSYNFRVNGTSQYEGGNNQFASSAFANDDKVTVVASNACGASAPSAPITMQIRETAPVTLTASPNPICNGGKTTLTASPSGSLEYTYFINGTSVAGPIPGNTYETVAGALTNNSKVKVVMKDACGESVSNEEIIKTLPLPQNVALSVSPNSTVCAGTSVTITATSGYDSYQFKVNGANVGTASANNSFTLNNVVGGEVIRVEVTDNCGNTATSKNAITMHVTPVPTPVLTFPSGKTICEGASLAVQAPEGWHNYDFMVNETTYHKSSSNTTSISGLKNGDKVSVRIQYSCGGAFAYAISPDYEVIVNPKPTATLVADPIGNQICAGASVTFTATGGGTYQYMLNNTNISGANSSVYTKTDIKQGDKIGVKVTNSNGCSATAVLPPYEVAKKLVITWDSNNTKSVCAGDPIVLKTSQSYDSYTWDVAGDALFQKSGTQNQTITITTGNNDTLFPVETIDKVKNAEVTLTVVKGGCISEEAKVIIPVYRIPRTGSPYHLKNDVAQ